MWAWCSRHSAGTMRITSRTLSTTNTSVRPRHGMVYPAQIPRSSSWQCATRCLSCLKVNPTFSSSWSRSPSLRSYDKLMYQSTRSISMLGNSSSPSRRLIMQASIMASMSTKPLILHQPTGNRLAKRASEDYALSASSLASRMMRCCSLQLLVRVPSPLQSGWAPLSSAHA
jgi:hypothetical protein